MTQAWTQLIVFGFISTLAALPSNVAAEGCKDLDPNSEPYLDDGRVIHCRCRQGYVKFNGHCRLVEEVRTRLEERLKKARAGGQEALYAWGNEAVGEAAASALDARKSVELLANLKGGDFAKQLVKVEVKLAQLLVGMKDCDYTNPDLRTNCQNIKTFDRLVHDTLVELEKLPTP